MKTLIIDNYDSYTYNLYQLVAEVSNVKPLVIKNDECNLEELCKLDFDNVILSPGPGRPDKREDFGLCEDIIKYLNKPILGVCLGHQGIYYINGGEIVLAPRPVHGEISEIFHNDKGIFKGIPQGFKVTRYHSLICKYENLENINIDATTQDGLIMGISHKYKPIYGVQFHPESICSEYGREIIENFLKLSEKYYQDNSLLKVSKFKAKFDSVEIFKCLKAYDEKIQWLDSSLIREGLSRFSIFGLGGSRSHFIKYNISSNQLSVITQDNIKHLKEDIFTYLKKNLKNWSFSSTLPFDFQLGYIGYLGYELKGCTNIKNNKVYEYPDAYFRYVDRAVILDHKDDMLYILSYDDDKVFHEEMKEVLSKKVKNTEESIEELGLPKIKLRKNKKEYISLIEECKEYIVKGESYEICLTNRMDIDRHLDPVKYYKILRSISPAPYSALLNFDEISIASSSMERFLKINKDGIMETKPIKGTIKRGKDDIEDKRLMDSLKEEIKTKAENLMIVDLLRNDLGKVAKVGTVNVPKLMEVETYSTLHQLVTTIKGELEDEYDIIDALKVVFPGGSMTGAPKKRTLEIIDKLEDFPRGVYSGAIGYISNNNTLDFNIVIRTAVIEKNRTTLGVGGAIINLSDSKEEFEEILLKAKGVLRSVNKYYGLLESEDIKIEGI